MKSVCSKYVNMQERNSIYLLPAGSKERGVLGVGSIPFAILSSCQDVRKIAL